MAASKITIPTSCSDADVSDISAADGKATLLSVERSRPAARRSAPGSTRRQNSSLELPPPRYKFMPDAHAPPFLLQSLRLVLASLKHPENANTRTCSDSRHTLAQSLFHHGKTSVWCQLVTSDRLFVALVQKVPILRADRTRALFTASQQGCVFRARTHVGSQKPEYPPRGHSEAMHRLRNSKHRYPPHLRFCRAPSRSATSGATHRGGNSHYWPPNRQQTRKTPAPPTPGACVRSCPPAWR